MRGFKKAALAVGFVLSLAAKAEAATLFDTGEGTRSYAVLGKSLVNVAGWLDFGSDVVIEDIESFIQPVGDSSFLFAVRTANAIGNPGATIFSQTSEHFAEGADANWVGLHNLGLHLAAGGYWFTVTGATGVNHLDGYMWGAPPNPLARGEVNIYQSGWQRLRNAEMSLRVTGTGGVPVSLDDPLPTILPEPAAWALMILGFVATGIALRRRHSAA